MDWKRIENLQFARFLCIYSKIVESTAKSEISEDVLEKDVAAVDGVLPHAPLH